jgi:hypothetical protein
MMLRNGLAAALLAALLLLSAGAPAQTQPAAPASGDIAGDWAASVLGQTVTASFTRQGDMLYGVVVIPDIGGGANTYHVAGVTLGDEFAAQHASGHLLKGAVTGPNDAQAVFTPKSGPPISLAFKRRSAP